MVSGGPSLVSVENGETWLGSSEEAVRDTEPVSVATRVDIGSLMT